MTREMWSRTMFIVRGHGLPVDRMVLAEGGTAIRAMITGSASRCSRPAGACPGGVGRWRIHGQGTVRRPGVVVLVRPAQRGQDQRRAPVHHVEPVRLGGHVQGQADPLHPRLQRSPCRSSDPPMDTKTLTSSRSKASMASTASTPWPRGESDPNSSRASAAIPFAPEMPMVVAGPVPADRGPVAGLAELPSRVHHFLDGATECGCCVSPRASRRSAFRPDQHPATSSICFRGQAGGLLISSQSRSRRAGTRRKSVCASTKERSTTVPGFRSSSSRWPRAWQVPTTSATFLQVLVGQRRAAAHHRPKRSADI